jgi:hypothetical protein
MQVNAKRIYGMDNLILTEGKVYSMMSTNGEVNQNQPFIILELEGTDNYIGMLVLNSCPLNISYAS